MGDVEWISTCIATINSLKPRYPCLFESAIAQTYQKVRREEAYASQLTSSKQLRGINKGLINAFLPSDQLNTAISETPENNLCRAYCLRQRVFMNP